MFGILKKVFGGDDSSKRAKADSRTESEAAATGAVVSESVFVSTDPTKGVSLEEAAEMSKDAMARIDDSGLPVTQKINAAAQLMLGGAFKECIEAYEKIMALHPERSADCLAQIGAARFFLAEYETAIDYYKRALEAGADEDMMRDNIEEAEEAIAKRDA